MSSGENVLWIVTKRHRLEQRPRKGMLVFRTRAAAVKYCQNKQAKSRDMCYHADRATWGPEQ